MVTKPIHLFLKLKKFFADAMRQLPGDSIGKAGKAIAAF
jgi:hypothetical protein